MAKKASDYRRAGRYYQQDKARRERRKAVDAVEDRFRELSYQVLHEGRRDLADDRDAARRELQDLDPDNSALT